MPEQENATVEKVDDKDRLIELQDRYIRELENQNEELRKRLAKAEEKIDLIDQEEEEKANKIKKQEEENKTEKYDKSFEYYIDEIMKKLIKKEDKKFPKIPENPYLPNDRYPQEGYARWFSDRVKANSSTTKIPFDELD
jgi:hypothetical protein